MPGQAILRDIPHNGPNVSCMRGMQCICTESAKSCRNDDITEMAVVTWSNAFVRRLCAVCRSRNVLCTTHAMHVSHLIQKATTSSDVNVNVCARAIDDIRRRSTHSSGVWVWACVRRLMNTENISMNILYVWDDTWKINCYCFACVRLSASVYMRTLFVFRLLFLFLLFGVCWYIYI